MAIKGWMKAGSGTNSRVELLALWALLFVSKTFKVDNIFIIGDSQIIIGWANGDTNFHSLLLEHWKTKVRLLITSFLSITFKHIYSELNSNADMLSKLGIGEMDFRIHYETWHDSTISLRATLPFD